MGCGRTGVLPGRCGGCSNVCSRIFGAGLGGGVWGCVGVGRRVVWGLRRGGLLVRGCAVWVSGLVFLVRLSVG